MTRFDEALEAENRPHSDGSRVSTVIVERDGRETLCCTGDYGLARACAREVLRRRGVMKP